MPFDNLVGSFVEARDVQTSSLEVPFPNAMGFVARKDGKIDEGSRLTSA